MKVRLNLNNIPNPCKDCKNKGCGSYHDVCERFQEYRKKIEKRKEEKKAHLTIELYRK